MNKITQISVILLFTSLKLWGSVISIPEDASNIQDGIDLALNGDTVLVSPGEYRENLYLGGKNIIIAGTYILSDDTTAIISTVLLPLNSRIRILTIDSTTTGRIEISGLTFRNGYVDDPLEGGAIRADSVESLLIDHCRFINNRAWLGGGVYIYRSDSMVQNCFFSENEGVGAAGLEAMKGSIEVENNVFFENISTREGGGIRFIEVTSAITNNKFVQNISTSFGGAVHIIRQGDIVIHNNDFIQNSSRKGGAVFLAGIIDSLSTLSVSNNNFQNNTANTSNGGLGGALYVAGYTQQTIENNTFIENYAFNAGVIFVKNDILFHNNYCRGNTAITGSAIHTMQDGLGHITHVEIVDNVFIDNILTTFEGNPERRGLLLSMQWTNLTISQNDFYNNQGKAVTRYSWFPQDSCIVNLGDNYYGDPTGPYHEEANPDGMGDTILANIPMEGFSSTPFTGYRLANIRQIERSHDFGTVPPGSATSWTLPIRNGGSASLVISNIEAGNPAFILGTTPDSIGTGETYELEILFAPQEIGSYRDELIIESNNCWDSLLVIPIQGQCRSTNEIGDEEELPRSYNLSKPYPNPFNPSTRFKYDIPEGIEINISVTNILGQERACLYNGFRQAGSYDLTFDASGYPAGIYFLTLTSSSYTHTEKMLLLK